MKRYLSLLTVLTPILISLSIAFAGVKTPKSTPTILYNASDRAQLERTIDCLVISAGSALIEDWSRRESWIQNPAVRERVAVIIGQESSRAEADLRDLSDEICPDDVWPAVAITKLCASCYNDAAAGQPAGGSPLLIKILD